MIQEFKQGEQPFEDPGFRDKLNSLVRFANSKGGSESEAGCEMLDVGDDENGSFFWAKITGATGVSGNSGKFLYDWLEQIETQDGWADKIGGRTQASDGCTTALNSHESNNVDGMIITSVEIGKVVLMWQGVDNQTSPAATFRFLEIDGDLEDQFFARITGHNDLPGREWSYTWQEVVPDPATLGAWINQSRTNESVIAPFEVALGEAINGMEKKTGLTVARPISTGSIVRMNLTVRLVDGVVTPVMAISASNVERQFFAKITGFSSGYYSWEECYADGTSIPSYESPQSGTRGVNSYYGTGDLTNVVPNNKIVLMESLPSIGDPDLVGFCVALEANGKDIHGDDYDTEPSSLPSPYPPDGGSPVTHGHDGALIRVVERDDPDHPGQRILQIYHLPPTVDDPSKEYNTLDNTTTAGTPVAGGGVGSFALTPQVEKLDAWGHQRSSTDGTDIVVNAGSHLEIVGTDTNITIQHSDPGTSTTTEEISAESVSGGAAVVLPPVGFDDKGHKTSTPEGNDRVNFIGDDWIDIAAGGADEIDITHQTAQADGALMISGAMFVAATGSVTWKLTNPYVDSKGHVNVADSNSTMGTISAGDGIGIDAGTSTSATIKSTKYPTAIAFSGTGASRTLTMTLADGTTLTASFTLDTTACPS